MALLVQKFGGTSVGNPLRLEYVADKVSAARRLGHDVVVVVSAMGEETDRLLSLAREVHPAPPARELDVLLATGEQASMALLALALGRRDCPARSMTGAQAGIRTDGTYGKARIVSIDPEPVRGCLRDGAVAVVAGFQGTDTRGELTTLGRGGSDTTAVALAAELHADECQIFTDVDGVYTADPRIVSKARRLPRITFGEMLELAGLGSKVLQARAVELAGNYRVPLRVLSTFMAGAGTLIDYEDNMEAPRLTGIAYAGEEALVSLRRLRDRNGLSGAILGPLAEANVEVDMLVLASNGNGGMDVSFTVHRDDADRALRVLRPVAEEEGAGEVTCNDRIAKVSLVGVGVRRSHAAVASRICKVLAAENIGIHLLSASEIKVSAALDDKYLELAVRSLHDAFEMDRSETLEPTSLTEAG